MKTIKMFGDMVSDYAEMFHKSGLSVMFRKPPKHYLDYTLTKKPPIILIPGITEKWNSLQALADPLSFCGHPVYMVKSLGYNIDDIHEASQRIRSIIDEKGLKNVIILAHSKGGLIGKHTLIHENKDGRILRLITIATPFAGSGAAKFVPLKSIRELSPKSEAIQRLQAETNVNALITSIFGAFDNHVWPTESCRLEGANNIQVGVHGHHRILVDESVRSIILGEVDRISDSILEVQKAAVGVGVMILKEGKVLLGRRKGSHGAGEYSFPGGHLEHLEPFETCARREVQEECGIEIENVHFQFVANVAHYAPKHYVHIGVRAEWKAGEPKVLERDRREEWVWFDFDALPEPLFHLSALAIKSHKTGQNYYDIQS